MEPYVGEIWLVGFNFAPPGFFPCDGRLLPIAEYDVLYNLIGTTYGGDGQNTFGLPDLRGYAPNHMGQGNGLNNYSIGQKSGTTTVTLNGQQIPSHSHNVQCNNGPGSAGTATGNYFAAASGELYAANVQPTGAMANTSLPAGNSQPHDNLQQYLSVTYMIAVYGIYPSPS